MGDYNRCKHKIKKLLYLCASEIVVSLCATGYVPIQEIKEYCLINGYRLVDTPREKNARCPCDFLTREESEQFKETLERVLKRSDGK